MSRTIDRERQLDAWRRRTPSRPEPTASEPAAEVAPVIAPEPEPAAPEPAALPSPESPPAAEPLQEAGVSASPEAQTVAVQPAQAYCPPIASKEFAQDLEAIRRRDLQVASCLGVLIAAVAACAYAAKLARPEPFDPALPAHTSVLDPADEPDGGSAIDAPSDLVPSTGHPDQAAPAPITHRSTWDAFWRVLQEARPASRQPPTLREATADVLKRMDAALLHAAETLREAQAALKPGRLFRSFRFPG